jgi:hypothetical protein
VAFLRLKINTISIENNNLSFFHGEQMRCYKNMNRDSFPVFLGKEKTFLSRAESATFLFREITQYEVDFNFKELDDKILFCCRNLSDDEEICRRFFST